MFQGLGSCRRPSETQDNDKRRLGRGVKVLGLALDLFVEVGAIVWETIFRCAFWWCCCVWFDA